MRKASNAVVERQKQRLAEIKGRVIATQRVCSKRLRSTWFCTLMKTKTNCSNPWSKIELEYPIDVVIKRATKSRSLAQNRTQWQWFKDAASQGDQKAWEYRGYCKLHFGVPILRRDSLEYREKYDRIIRPMSYEQKLELMVEPFDFPVTSAMNVAQHGEFLDSVKQHFESVGFKLTDPQRWDV